MTGQGLYLCGCNPLDPKVQNYKRDLVFVPGMKDPVLSSKRYDKDGNEICPIHGKPLYGFMTVTKTGPQGNDVYDHKAEIERMYGGKIPEIAGPLGSPDIEDKRMNQDPEEVYMALQAERATTNGHADV